MTVYFSEKLQLKYCPDHIRGFLEPIVFRLVLEKVFEHSAYHKKLQWVWLAKTCNATQSNIQILDI